MNGFEDYFKYTNLFPTSETPSESENNKSENSKNSFNPTTFIQSEFDVNNKKDYYNLNNHDFNNNPFQNKENNNIANNLYENLDINDRHYYIQNNDIIKENEFSNTITLNNGKVIKPFNKMIVKSIFDLLKISEIDYDKLKDMQLLRNKRRRRTKKEIEEEKTLKTEDKNIIVKKKGRRQKEELKNIDENNIDDTHSKKADDNIIKKINTNFLKNYIKWLNSSFLDEKGNFLPEKNKFLKIKPIFDNLKKQKVTTLMATKFKDILINDISEKYKNLEGNPNKNLVEKIYSENKEYFVIFILELTFIDAFHIYNGEKSLDDFKILFLKEKKIEEKKIEEFYNNFNKVDLFLKKIYDDEIKNQPNADSDIKDYIIRICLLSSNYEIWFKRKFNRKPNKKHEIIK